VEVHEALRASTGTEENTGKLTPVVDGLEKGFDAPRRINRCVGPVVVEEPVLDAVTIEVNSDDLSLVVDAGSA
jgi:hypothetical protein